MATGATLLTDVSIRFEAYLERGATNSWKTIVAVIGGLPGNPHDPGRTCGIGVVSLDVV